MGLLSIFGKISLDSSGFQSALKSTEKAADKMAGKFRNQVGGALLGAFSIGKVVSYGKELLDQAKTIDQLAKKFNLTTDEVQLLQQEAANTGVSFESMVENASDLEATLARVHGGQVAISRENVEMLNTARQAYDVFKTEAGLNVARLFGLAGDDTELTGRQREFLEKDAAKKRSKDPAAKAEAHMAMMDRVVEMDKKAAELTNKAHTSSLTKEQRLNELLAEQSELRKENWKDWINEEAIAEKGFKIAQNESEIAALRASMRADSVKELSPLSDSLRSVGNFLGGDPNSGVTRKLSDMHRELQEIRRNTARAGSGLQFPL